MSSEVPMPSSDLCPTLDQLQAFNRGELDASTFESISSHLQVCERCALFLLSLSDAASGACLPKVASGATPPDRADPTHSHVSQSADGSDSTVTLSGEAAPTAIGRYDVLRVLGRGGFGVVYLARDAQLDRLVAIKAPYIHRIKRPADLHGYRREARLLASVDHAHIVPIYDVGEADGAPFFVVSKFVPGIDLATRLRSNPPPLRTIAQWIATLAEALDHVHRQGLIHRDVKPRNIMVDPADRVYLMDFGLAKQVALHTGAEPIVGTPAYMAPEQARGESLDGRCDVYALGVVLYEMLTGQRPFRGAGRSILQQVLTTDPPLPRSIKRGIPRDLEAICVKALAKDRERRYRTAADLADDLRRWLRDEPLRLARRVGPLERAWSWMRRHRAVAALGGVAAAALALSGFAWLGGRAGAAPTHNVFIQTKPPGALVHFFPLDDLSGLPRPDRSKKALAGETVQLTPGYHLVVAVLEDGRFHEVFRYVPSDLDELADAYTHNAFEVKGGSVRLPTVNLPEQTSRAGMSRVAGADRFKMGLDDAGVHFRCLPDYYLDCQEVTVKEFLEVHPDFRFPEGVVRPPNNWPMIHVNWDDAVAYAEKIGKRLPDETEYEYAATHGGRQFRRLAALAGWAPAPSGQPEIDRWEVPGRPPIFGLCSNVAEWTGSWAPADPKFRRVTGSPFMQRVVRGAPRPVVEGDPGGAAKWAVQEQLFLDRPLHHPGLGFRCALSPAPRLNAEDFIGIVP